MAMSSYVQTSFLGGEISQSAQGRLDLPAYKVSLNVCINALPVESGAWMRRPGTRHVAPTRGGAAGKLIPFTFAQNFPYVMEFTDGYLRFTTGPALAMTNDAQAVVSISTANPAKVKTTTAHTWATGNSVSFNSLGVHNPLLQNRQFLITVTSSTEFTIADAVTGASIDGATLGAFVSGNVTRILEIATSYASGSWLTMRSVQAEERTLLLNGTRPQVLEVDGEPSTTQFATFTYNASNFIDGPYLDPIAGSYVTSSALNGVVTLTFSFQAYDAAVAYNIGDFVTSVGINYQSLTALNVNNTPATSPANWAVVNGGAAVNDGLGFVSSDIGRLIRLLSEPQLWTTTGTYSTGTVVAYADGNGGFSYWTATGAVGANIQPGTSTLWAINATGAIWTWGQIVSVSGVGLIPPATAIGTMTLNGGLASAFDGNTTKAYASSAAFQSDITTYPSWSPVSWLLGSLCQYGGIGYRALLNIVPYSSADTWNSSVNYGVGNSVQYFNFIYTCLVANGPASTGAIAPTNRSYWSDPSYAIDGSVPSAVPVIWQSLGAMPQPLQRAYVGQHYASPTAVQYATLYPSTDVGLGNSPNGGLSMTVTLRAKATAPTSSSDGTSLGSVQTGLTTAAITITSNDQVTAWSYVWFEVTMTVLQPLPDNGAHVFTAKISAGQAQFYSPNVANGSVITLQIRGPALLYAQTIRTWRAGVYSDTTGWPTCGTYHEGRLWLGGVVTNRFDAGVSNGFIGSNLDFTPTAPSGAVASNNAISYVCTGEDSNQILWMTPDQQGILFGTKSGEWLISAPSAGPLGPTNIKAVRVTKIGCADIEPKRAEHTLLIVQKFGRKIVEYFADVFSGKFSAPNLSDRAKHLTVGGISEIAYQQELAPTVWCRRTDGALVGATYKRDTLTTSQGPNIIGWHRHALGSGRTVESLCVGPSVNGNLDTPSMITTDPATGIRHIEVMTDLLDEGFALTDCWFLDDAVVPSSTVVQSEPTGGVYGSLLVNGLSIHEGKTVTAYIAGLDCGDYVVSGGSITVPFGDGVSAGSGAGLFTAALVNSYAVLPAVVGFTYISDGQLVRPVTQADTGAQAGPGFAKLGRLHRVSMQVYGVVNGSLSFGTDFVNMDPVRFRYANDVPYTVLDQWSGIWRQEPQSKLDYDGMISWRISRPNPAFVIAVGGFMAKADA